jgi:membrane-associated phospholipid phosphatase
VSFFTVVKMKLYIVAACIASIPSVALAQSVPTSLAFDGNSASTPSTSIGDPSTQSGDPSGSPALNFGGPTLGTGIEGEHLKLSYLWDGGMIPFFWAPMLGRLALDHYVSPGTTPLMFSSSEGGAARSSWEVPGWSVTAAGGAVALGMLASGAEGGSYHAKGLAESLMSGALMTGIIKDTFARHRPDWSPTNDTPSERSSFPSGHTTQAFAIASYSIMYLHGHVFNKTRGDHFLSAPELLSYTGITLAASAVGAERILHDRHNLTDVAAGAVLGTVSSMLFYKYQEHRYQDHKAREIMFTPSVTSTSATVGVAFKF